MRMLLVTLWFSLIGTHGMAQADLSTGIVPGELKGSFQPDKVPYISPSSLPQVKMPDFNKSGTNDKPPVDFVEEGLKNFSNSKKSFKTESAPTWVDGSKQNTEKRSRQVDVASDDKNNQITGTVFIIIVLLSFLAFIFYSNHKNSVPDNTKVKINEHKEKSKLLALKEMELELLEREIELTKREQKLKNT